MESAFCCRKGSLMDSILQDDKSYCYIHKNYLGITIPAQHEHHCIHGNANRKLADEDGLTVFLCVSCHSALHDKGIYDLKLQQLAEVTWLEQYNKTVEDWIKRYGKNYLD